MSKLSFKGNPSARLTIPCPKCGHKQNELVSRLRTSPQITCGGCNGVISVNGKEINDLMKTLERFGR